MALIETLVFVVQIYLVLGLLFGIAFVARGVQAIDPAAQGTGWGFRLILLPGVSVFWPWLLVRWLRRRPPSEERNAHRDLTRRT